MLYSGRFGYLLYFAKYFCVQTVIGISHFLHSDWLKKLQLLADFLSDQRRRYLTVTLYKISYYYSLIRKLVLYNARQLFHVKLC